MTKGYIRSAVRNAVKQGADIFSVLRCACSNPAEHYGMKSGLLREGDSADFIMVNNLEDFSVLRVYIKGTCIFSNDGPAQLPEPFPQTLQVLNDFCAQPLHADSILVRAQHSIEKVNVISCSDGEACTMHKKIIMNAHGGYIRSEPDIDCLKLVYYSRYSSFAPRTAFVQGFGLKEGALAVSVSHDEHNIIAFGVSDCDIVSAVNRVIALEGGIVFTLNGEVITEAPLSVAGIISNEPAEKVIDKIGKIKTALLLSGCTLERPVTTLSNCALTSVPVLKISEGGLFDVASQEEISLFCSV
jgi:adenine deaminase